MNHSMIAKVSFAGMAVTAMLGSAFAQTAPRAAAAAPAAFAQCAVCHATTANAPKKLGPTLAGVAGKPAATRPGFTYSAALKGAKIVWTDAKLDAFLAKPSQVVPGTKMAFGGISNAATRAQLIAHMKTLR
jgi:cytochrome c